MTYRVGILLLVMLLVACGDDGSPTDAAADTGSGDAATDTGAPDTGAADASPDAADPCAGAVDGAACTTPGVTCGGPCPDACSFCNLLRCEDGMWSGLEAGPAPCFSCGTGAECQINVDYCLKTIGGPAPGTETFECTAPPADCAGAVTCACLDTASVGGDCAEPNPGEVTVTFSAP